MIYCFKSQLFNSKVSVIDNKWANVLCFAVLWNKSGLCSIIKKRMWTLRLHEFRNTAFGYTIIKRPGYSSLAQCLLSTAHRVWVVLVVSLLAVTKNHSQIPSVRISLFIYHICLLVIVRSFKWVPLWGKWELMSLMPCPGCIRPLGLWARLAVPKTTFMWRNNGIQEGIAQLVSVIYILEDVILKKQNILRNKTPLIN